MSKEEKTHVKQGALIGGWVCFFLGSGIMYFSLWAFLLYGPILLAAFVLSISALAQRRIIGGVLLMLAVIISPTVQWLWSAVVRTDEFVQRLAPGVRDEYNAHKELGRELAEVALTAEPVPTSQPPAMLGLKPNTKSNPAAEFNVPLAPKAAVEITQNEPAQKATAPPPAHESLSPREEKKTVPVRKVVGDTIPLIYEIGASRPTPTDQIARFVLGQEYDTLDEFSKRDFLIKLESMVNEKKEEANREDIYAIEELVELGEYNFDEEFFPIRVVATGHSIETIDQANQRMLGVPGKAPGSKQTSLTDYVVNLEPKNELENAHVKLNLAKSFGPALRKSRRARLTYAGTLGMCFEEPDRLDYEVGSNIHRRVVQLNVTEVTLVIEASGQSITYPVARSPVAKAKEEGIAGTLPHLGVSELGPVAHSPLTNVPSPMFARPATIVPEVDPPDESADPYRAFFEAHFEKISRKDLPGVLEDYADQVTYFGTKVDKTHIQKDEIKDFATSQIIEESVVEVRRISPDDLEFEVLTTNARSQGNQWTTKHVRNTLKLIPSGDSFQIIEQAAKVLSTSNERPLETQ